MTRKTAMRSEEDNDVLISHCNHYCSHVLHVCLVLFTEFSEVCYGQGGQL